MRHSKRRKNKSKIKHSVLNMTESCRHPIPGSMSRPAAVPHERITINYPEKYGEKLTYSNFPGVAVPFVGVFYWRKSNYHVDPNRTVMAVFNVSLTVGGTNRCYAMRAVQNLFKLPLLPFNGPKAHHAAIV